MAASTCLYGPVRSWRFGRSLGIDLILTDSTCSFRCIYCQLGVIHEVTEQQRVFVPTEVVARELEAVDWNGVDVVTISGSGEPTLALNLGEVIDLVRTRYHKPVTVLTNSTLLTDSATCERLANATTVACKLDADDDAMLTRMNRPASGITMERILNGIRALRKSAFKGRLALQVMLMHANLPRVEALAKLASELNPDEVHLNTPRRPVPRQWYGEARGNHGPDAPVPTIALNTITLEQAQAAETVFRRLMPRVSILSVYHEAPASEELHHP